MAHKPRQSQRTRTLILASSSPQRNAILTKIGLPFKVVEPNVDETVPDRLSPEKTALRLARLKALTVAEKMPGSLVLGADTVVALGRRINPAAVVDAIIAKRNTGTTITDAQTVVGVGPGFTAGYDCHAVVETSRSHTLGRVIYEGGTIPNTGIPGNIGGYTIERLLRTNADGIFVARKRIGDVVHRGEVVAETVPEQGSGGAAPTPIVAAIDGILRGILPSGLPISQDMKAGDIDPRCEKDHCFTVSDKALAVVGGVLEALLHFGD